MPKNVEKYDDEPELDQHFLCKKWIIIWQKYWFIKVGKWMNDSRLRYQPDFPFILHDKNIIYNFNWERKKKGQKTVCINTIKKITKERNGLFKKPGVENNYANFIFRLEV